MAKDRAEIPEWIDMELRNWGAWCWKGAYPHPLPPTHCASPEWQYERIREDGEIESVDDKPIPVNETHAAIVQGVYEALPWLQAQVLRAEYPQRHSGAQKRMRAHFGADAYNAALNVAVFQVMAAFDRRG